MDRDPVGEEARAIRHRLPVEVMLGVRAIELRNQAARAQVAQAGEREAGTAGQALHPPFDELDGKQLGDRLWMVDEGSAERAGERLDIVACGQTDIADEVVAAP